ncbi:MAG: hypothetical protein FWG20_04410 [Candidatus Cloacimonetes bacterium]|nr:hypothetical protein [Candidatus Cloacimonadota bacterium]
MFNTKTQKFTATSSLKKFICLAVIAMTITLLFSLDSKTVDSFFASENSYDMVVQASELIEKGQKEEAIELYWEAWKVNRFTTSYLLTIGFLYSDINNPEMAGKFLLEFAKRENYHSAMNLDALQESFATVWESEVFLPYRDEAIALNISKNTTEKK